MTGGVNVVTITVDGERYELTDDLAVLLAEQLWEGLQRGAITAAARLSTALSRRGASAPTVTFPADESRAVRDALATLGVVDR